MKTKSNVLILLLFCSVSVFGQNLIWNPSVKLNERPYQKFLGTNNGYFYAAGSNIKMIQDISDSIFLTTIQFFLLPEILCARRQCIK